MILKELNKPKDAAKYLGVSYAELMNSKNTGSLKGVKAPKPVKFGRYYFYSKPEVEAAAKRLDEAIPPLDEIKSIISLGYGVDRIEQGYFSVTIKNDLGDRDVIVYNPWTKKAQFSELRKIIGMRCFSSFAQLIEYYTSVPLGRAKPTVYDKRILDDLLSKFKDLDYKDLDDRIFYDKDIFDKELLALQELVKSEDGSEAPFELIKNLPEMDVPLEVVIDSSDFVKGTTLNIKMGETWVTRRLIFSFITDEHSERVQCAIFQMLQNGYGYALEATDIKKSSNLNLVYKEMLGMYCDAYSDDENSVYVELVEDDD